MSIDLAAISRMASDLAATTATPYREALDALISTSEVLAKAWDEGAFDASMSLGHGGHNADNPYRTP